MALNQEARWTQQEFVDFFMCNGFFLDKSNTPPSLDAIVRLYEHLDENRNGCIDANDFFVFMKNVSKLRKVGWKISKFTSFAEE